MPFGYETSIPALHPDGSLTQIFAHRTLKACDGTPAFWSPASDWHVEQEPSESARPRTNITRASQPLSPNTVRATLRADLQNNLVPADYGSRNT